MAIWCMIRIEYFKIIERFVCMKKFIQCLLILSVFINTAQSAQLDKKNSTPCAPCLYSVVEVSVQENSDDQSCGGINGVLAQPADAVSIPPVEVFLSEPTQRDPEYHSYLRDVCQCVAVPCNAITRCCGNECRYIGETFDCQDDLYNKFCYAHLCFDPCDRMMDVFCDDTRDLRPDVYCGLQDPDHRVTSCICVPLSLIAAIATAPITISISCCCN